MEIRLMASVACALVVIVACVRWRVRVGRAWRGLWGWVWRVVRDSKTYRVLETFFVEAAVLWFVFPLLDTIYGHQSISGRLVHTAYGLAGMFLLFAILLSHASKPE